MQYELELKSVEYPKVYYEGYEAAIEGEKFDETKSGVWQCGFIDALKKLFPMSFC